LIEVNRGIEIPGPDVEMVEHAYAHAHAGHSLFCEVLGCPYPSTNRRPGTKRSRCPLLLRGYVAGPSDTPAGAPGAGAAPKNKVENKVADMAKVAFLGLGVMGFPMAGHLVKKGGHEVTVYNRTAAKAKQWAEKFGGKTAATPKAAAEGQDFVMCCVGNDNDLRAVTIGPDGAFAGLKKGATFVDH